MLKPKKSIYRLNYKSLAILVYTLDKIIQPDSQIYI